MTTAAATPTGKTVWIVTWAGSSLSGNPTVALASAQHSVATSTRTIAATFEFYVPATDVASAESAAQANATATGITLSGAAISAVDTGAVVS
jgi:hypothetical protein